MTESSVSTRLALRPYIQNDIYRNIPKEINDENKRKTGNKTTHVI